MHSVSNAFFLLLYIGELLEWVDAVVREVRTLASSGLARRDRECGRTMSIRESAGLQDRERDCGDAAEYVRLNCADLAASKYRLCVISSQRRTYNHHYTHTHTTTPPLLHVLLSSLTLRTAVKQPSLSLAPCHPNVTLSLPSMPPTSAAEPAQLLPPLSHPPHPPPPPPPSLLLLPLPPPPPRAVIPSSMCRLDKKSVTAPTTPRPLTGTRSCRLLTSSTPTRITGWTALCSIEMTVGRVDFPSSATETSSRASRLPTWRPRKRSSRT